MMPPDIAGMLAQPQEQAPDPLAGLQDAIHAVTAAMAGLPDPQDTQDAAQALQILARVQTRVMKGGAPGGPAA